MHPYSSDDAKPRTLSLIAVVSVIVSYLVSLALSPLSWPEWLVSAPSLAGAYALLYSWFDRTLWTTKLSRRLELSTIADVSGRYTGTLVSEYPPGATTQIDVDVVIVQRWTRIHVAMEQPNTGTSRSSSFMASVSSEGLGTRLTYSYRNQAQPGVADEDMYDHDGTADLMIDATGAARGRYFNGRPRKGSIRLQRVDSGSASPAGAGGG